MFAYILCLLLLAAGTSTGISYNIGEYRLKLPVLDLSDSYTRLMDIIKGTSIRLQLFDDKEEWNNYENDNYYPPPWLHPVPVYPIPPNTTWPPHTTLRTHPPHTTHPTPTTTEPTTNPTEPTTTPNPTEPPVTETTQITRKSSTPMPRKASRKRLKTYLIVPKRYIK